MNSKINILKEIYQKVSLLSSEIWYDVLIGTTTESAFLMFVTES